MKIYYWSPFTSKVATIKAVINSADSMKKFYNHETFIINAFGEWDEYKKELKKKNIKIINNKNKINVIFKDGFLLSRLLYLRIFLNSLLFLKRIITDDKPDYLVSHLITSLPIFLFNFFKFRTKLILRISGYPKLNIIRKFFWKISSSNIFKVTTPTKQTFFDIKNSKIFEKNKLKYLPDPVFDLKEFNRLKKNKENSKKFILNIGRLSKQKNQKLLISSFYKISKKYKNLKLFIIGDGEMKTDLVNLVKNLKMQKKIIFLGHIKNPYKFIKNSLCVIVTSLWEDPGFVMIESSAMKKIVICSDCPNGPKEFFKNGKNGFLFKNNSEKSLYHTFDKFMSTSKSQKLKFLKKNFKTSMSFSDLEHSKRFNSILNEKK